MRHFLFILFLFPCVVFAQYNIKGIVLDKETKETLVGANVLIKGTENGKATNYKGEFHLKANQLPVHLLISFIGYKDIEIEVSNQEFLIINMAYSQELMGEIILAENRITKKQREAALTVESIDLISIEQSTASNFYESLGQLKGVDITSASLGFKIINTRGFNSSSPVRSLQLINGVDNQSPGLNFSLGNFLGVSELDIQKVNVIAGASSAYFGPNAFNGVVEMETKSPFHFKGLDVSQKVAERSLLETAVRYARVWKNKDQEEKLGLKLNMFYLKANEWKANNTDPVTGADNGPNNPGGFDAVNIYGDEFINSGDNLLSDKKKLTHPGLGNIYRSGYSENDLVDSESNNAKLNMGLYYKINPDLELSYNFNYGSGSTIYQGDNRYRLEGIRFYQNIIELKQKDKWFFRFYSTKEDAGDTYDIYFTALRLQEQQATNAEWKQAYTDNWKEFYADQVKALPSYDDYLNGSISYEQFLSTNKDTIAYFHAQNRDFTDNFSYNLIEAGSSEFDSLFQDITSKSFAEGGTKFIDRSALYHAQGEYKFNIGTFEAKTGMSMRWYRPESEGTIFDEMRIVTNEFNERDTSFVTIKNQEWGSYFGLEKKWKSDALKTALIVRLDKNENFDYLFSPAISAVYNINENHLVRFSATAAIRNPTLQDQYLNYNVGTATLKGSLNGYDSLVTIDSFRDFITDLDEDTLDYFNVAEIRPEKVKTIEFGYRGSIHNKWYIDASTFYSHYTDFIGFEIGLDMDLSFGFPTNLEVLRLSSNASSTVQTTGFNLGLNHYFSNTFTFMGNYSWNKIVTGKNDPIVPAFNTPEHKFNLSANARNFSWRKNGMKNWSATISHKWVEGFNFEGSPQFTGMIDNYSSTDFQLSYFYKKWHSSFKFGANNLLNDKHYEIYGGPLIGRLVYLSMKYHLDSI